MPAQTNAPPEVTIRLRIAEQQITAAFTEYGDGIEHAMGEAVRVAIANYNFYEEVQQQMNHHLKEAISKAIEHHFKYGEGRYLINDYIAKAAAHGAFKGLR
jgi:hypothetical protein